jgi:ABC-type Fe3+ transport system substrate-binding protein
VFGEAMKEAEISISAGNTTRGAFWLPSLLLVGVLAIPFLFRDQVNGVEGEALPLVIISPHNEAIRYEFGQAFSAWHARNFGQAVSVDWRSIGGTTEISRYLASQYTSAFRASWIGQGHAWSGRTAAAFNNPKVKPDDPSESEEARQARQAFLASSAGIGIDLFFGGGEYDHSKQAAIGHLAPCGFRDSPEGKRILGSQIPEMISGEKWYDKNDLWYGVTVSAFGICFNRDVIRQLAGGREPQTWRDLGQPALFRRVALADPTKSGSSAKAFEMILQQEMALAVAEIPKGSSAYSEALSRGWREGWKVIRTATANSRYFSDSASKVPLDVANGDAAAGMCIDFYGLFQAAMVADSDGKTRMGYVSPRAGTTVGCDPISLLRGAPHPELAKRFIQFVLSMEGQRLWSFRVGEPGGPVRYALQRLPIRRDFYTPENLQHSSNPDLNPFDQAATFACHPEWTAKLFNAIRLLVKALAIDTGEELQTAWGAILAEGGTESCPEAADNFFALPENAEFEQIGATLASVKTKVDEIRLAREWGRFFAERYEEARRLATSRG